MPKSVKVDEATHRLITEMSRQTDLPFGTIIKYSLASFSKSKDYSMLVIYNKEPSKIAENDIGKSN